MKEEAENMKLKIHRGTTQIGGNIIEVSTEKTRIMLDCGANLPPLGSAGYKDTKEIDGLTRGESAYDALFISHHHGDHCGLLAKVKEDIPVYGSRESKAVLEIIADFIDSDAPKIQSIESGETVEIGDIRVLPLSVRHSAKGALMFVVESDGKKLLYTGDFRELGDGVPDEALRGVDVMLCEGTNIDRDGELTEADVEKKAAQIMKETKGNVFVLSSATNIDRLAAIEKACQESGRTLAVDVFLRAVTDAVAPFRSTPIGFVPRRIMAAQEPRIHNYLMKYRSRLEFFGKERIAKLDSLTVMVRESMGKFLNDIHDLRTASTEGGTLIYSKWKGYQDTERMEAFLKLCGSLGIKAVDLHASGHAYKKGIEALIARVEPETLAPVHTESREAFRHLYKNVVFPNDNEEIDV
jgi:ribonuclease J